MTAPAATTEPTNQPDAPAQTATQERRSRFDALRVEIRQLGDVTADAMTTEQESRLEQAIGEFEALEPQIAADERRSAVLDRVRQSAANGSADRGFDGVPGQINRQDGALDLRSATRDQLRDGAMRVIEERGDHLSDAQKTKLERMMRRNDRNIDGADLARRALVTETDDYRSAFQKAMAFRAAEWTDAERHAMSEYRAANEGTPSAGGYGIPILIDPSIILTSGAAGVPLMDIADVINITTSAWKGVSSQGVSWAFQAEAATVADDSPTLAQPSIPVYTARGFIPYSIEVGDDYPGFQDEMAKLMAQGYVDLMALKTAVGSGSGEPTGIFTRMLATTPPAHVVVASSATGTLQAVDIRTAWQALPERFRANATWAMHTEVENIIAAFGNGLALSDFTVNLSAAGPDRLKGRPIVTSDYMPTFTATTTQEQALVVGDFSHFKVVQRLGMEVELVPHIFDPTTGRPTGQRGWFAVARVGSDVDTALAFRTITNT